MPLSSPDKLDEREKSLDAFCPFPLYSGISRIVGITSYSLFGGIGLTQSTLSHVLLPFLQAIMPTRSDHFFVGRSKSKVPTVDAPCCLRRRLHWPSCGDLQGNKSVDAFCIL